VPGVEYRLPSKKNTRVRTVHCFHTTSDVGYVVCATESVVAGKTAEIQAEFELCKEAAKVSKCKQAGKRMGEMRKEGLLVTTEVAVPKIAYLLDSTVQVLGPCAACQGGDGGEAVQCPFADPAVAPWGEACFQHLKREGTAESGVLFAQQLEWIFACPTIVIECSFVAAAGMSEAEAEQEAIKRGHVAWSQLRPHVCAHPKSVFVLTHFSKRYTDAELREFFAAELVATEGCVCNVVLWLDSGVLDFRGQVAN